MTPLPDLMTYQDREALTPPDPADEECWCGRLYCGHEPWPTLPADEREPVAKEDL